MNSIFIRFEFGLNVPGPGIFHITGAKGGGASLNLGGKRYLEVFCVSQGVRLRMSEPSG